MFLGGLWHGASWNFVLWGLFHGVALAFHKMWMMLTGRQKGEKSHGLSRALGAYYISFCLFLLDFLRNANFDNSVDMLRQIFTAFRPQLLVQLVEGYWKVFALMLLGYLLHFAPRKWKMLCAER